MLTVLHSDCGVSYRFDPDKFGNYKKFNYMSKLVNMKNPIERTVYCTDYIAFLKLIYHWDYMESSVGTARIHYYIVDK